MSATTFRHTIKLADGTILKRTTTSRRYTHAVVAGGVALSWHTSATFASCAARRARGQAEVVPVTEVVEHTSKERSPLTVERCALARELRRVRWYLENGNRAQARADNTTTVLGGLVGLKSVVREIVRIGRRLEALEASGMAPAWRAVSE
jgi:hypothetical protein